MLVISALVLSLLLAIVFLVDLLYDFLLKQSSFCPVCLQGKRRWDWRHNRNCPNGEYISDISLLLKGSTGDSTDDYNKTIQGVSS